MGFPDESAAAVGGTYEFTRLASANLREKDDSLNTAIGGFLAGSVLGLRCEWLPRVFVLWSMLIHRDSWDNARGPWYGRSDSSCVRRI